MNPTSLDLQNRVDSEKQPVEHTASSLIELAIQLRASDLFLMMNEKSVEVRVRQLGILRTVRDFSLEYGRKLVSHFKAMSGIDIADHFRPLEGRWVFSRGSDTPVDLRLNVMPTLFGEDVACRILDRQRGLLQLDELNVGDEAHQALLSLLKNPSGLLLVTGPTGSGKTTTLYSCLQHLNDGQRKINTLEDPIEYVLEGIRQSQIRPKMGVDFAELLAACLRQAPDVIMIGEIRDANTARIAVRAANSGHLVLATLHAPIAAATPFTLKSFGVNPHFLSSCLLGIISQRLVRHLCPNCRVEIDVSDHPTLFDDVRKLIPSDAGNTMYAAGECEQCFGSGYDRPLCIAEIMTMNEKLRRIVVEGKPMRRLQEAAMGSGMTELRRAALVQIALGNTTTEEMFRCIPFEYFDSNDMSSHSDAS